MNEEASAGGEIIQRSRAGFRKRAADSKDNRNIWFSVRPNPWKDHCLIIPRECPSARVFRFRNCDTVSSGGEGWGKGIKEDGDGAGKVEEEEIYS
jgi:hypothetical protein